LKRDIHDSTQRLWDALVPNNLLPSGTSRIHELVEKLRGQMFDVWKFAKTHSASKVKYADQEMTGSCLLWHPTWWNVWKAMGPAAGANCSATFMSEVGMKIATLPTSMPAILEGHFEGQAAGGSANVSLLSRAKLAKERNLKREPAAESEPTPLARTNDLRTNCLQSKAVLDLRKMEIRRLQFLSNSPHSTPREITSYNYELFQLMKSPILTVFSDTSTPTPTSSSKKYTDSDAADVPHFLPIQPRALAPLLMPAEQIIQEHPAFDKHEEELNALRGNPDLNDSCPVDMEAADFAASCLSSSPVNLKTGQVLWLTKQATRSDGSCCTSAIFESLRCLNQKHCSIISEDKMPIIQREVRESVCDFISANSNLRLECLGNQTFREGIVLTYVKNRKEVRDSDYIRAAMEATPQEDPAQLVSSFYGWLCAMRKPRCYCDEFFVVGAALFYNCQICVARQFGEKKLWKPSFYSGPR
jgi:hypothetical protein